MTKALSGVPIETNGGTVGVESGRRIEDTGKAENPLAMGGGAIGGNGGGNDSLTASPISQHPARMATTMDALSN